jgi:hypothetical protein
MSSGFAYFGELAVLLRPFGTFTSLEIRANAMNMNSSDELLLMSIQETMTLSIDARVWHKQHSANHTVAPAKEQPGYHPYLVLRMEQGDGVQP